MQGWLLGFHVLGLILWMGGLFGLTRHAGMHAELVDLAAEPRKALNVYESKSYLMGSLPGLILTVGTGLWMLFANPALYLKASGPWGSTFHIKLLLVAIIIGVDQFFFFRMRKLHNSGEGKRGQFMMLHGILGLCFIIIVLLMKTRLMA